MPKTWKIGNFCNEEKKSFNKYYLLYLKIAHNSKFTHEHFLTKVGRSS